MRFEQLEDEIKECEKHLDETQKRYTEAESYLVRYLLVRICAEYETRIKTLAIRRCSRTNDEPIKNISAWAIDQLTKRFRISDMGNMLERFSEDYKKTFSIAVDKQSCVAAWDNIVNNRHTVAHGNGSVQMSLDDLKRDFATSRTVIEELVRALCLTEREKRGIR